MKYLKEFKIFESVLSDIDFLCKKYRIKNYTINGDGTIDVNGDVDLGSLKLTKLPLKFRNVSGNFRCNNNQLITLEGGPQSVGSGFYCHYNQLTSLEGCPQSVGRDFYCQYNQLTSLEGSPVSVGGDFNCSDNQLTGLEGGPKSVSGDFFCRNNQLVSLEGGPQSVGGYFNCRNNPIYVVWNLFRDYSKIELLNDYDPLREVDGEPAILIDRFNDFLMEIGKDPVEKLKGWVNI